MRYLLLFAFFLDLSICAHAQTCDVDFPGSSSLDFSTECGGSSIDDLTLGKDTFMGDNDDFTFDSPATININGNFQVNAEGDGKIIIPAGVTVNVSGNFQLDAQNSGCESGSSCTFEFVVNGTLNVNSNLQNNLVTLIWSGTGTVDVDDSFEITSNGCMECGSTCPAFPAGSGGCSDDGDGCSIDFCVDGNYGNTSPLPVILLFFKGEVQEGKVLLEWATSSEINFDFFTIERSTNVQEFYAIGTVAGNGFSESRIDYSFYDVNPLVGRSFYRLKATDFDGSVEYFEIVSVVYNNRFVKIHSNPIANGEPLRATVKLEHDQAAYFTVYTILGVKVFQIPLTSGTYDLLLPDLKPGVYMTLIHYPGSIRSSKLVIR